MAMLCCPPRKLVYLFRRQEGRRRRFCFRVFCMVAIFMIYYEINVSVTSSWNSFVSRKSGECENSQEDKEDLLYLIRSTHEVLNKFKLDPFLIYGSLWGALRLNNPLPWDYDFDVGVLYEDFQGVNVDEIITEFTRRGIKMFRQIYFGNYKVQKGKMTGDIMLYKHDNEKVYRMGVESYLFFVHYSHYHQFPTRLIAKPLPKLKFADRDYSVPREGIEIQKHMYPTNWWKVVLPDGCNITFKNSPVLQAEMSTEFSNN